MLGSPWEGAGGAPERNGERKDEGKDCQHELLRERRTPAASSTRINPAYDINIASWAGIMRNALSLVRPEPPPRNLGKLATAAVWNIKAVAERKIKLRQLERNTASISEVSADQLTIR